MIKQLDLYNLCEANKYEEIAGTLHMNHHYNEEDSRHYLYYGETFTKAAIVLYKGNPDYTFGIQYSSGSLISSISIRSTNLLNYSITNNGILFGLYSSTSPLELKYGYFLGKNLSTNNDAFIGVTITTGLNISNLDVESSFHTDSGNACYNSNYSCSLTPLIFEKDSTTILVETAYLINVGPLSKIQAFNFRMNNKVYTRMTKPNPASTGAFWNIVIEDIE